MPHVTTDGAGGTGKRSVQVRVPETVRHAVFLVLGISGASVTWWAATIIRTAILLLIVANVGLVIVDTEPYFDTR